jgi:hypothetical protein
MGEVLSAPRMTTFDERASEAGSLFLYLRKYTVQKRRD